MDISSSAHLEAAAVTDLDWEEVYRSLLPKVFHYFAYRVGNRQVAEDLTAATFERAWRGRRRYRKDLGGFTQWIFGIARNVAREHYRRRLEEQGLGEAEAVSGGGTPESSLGRKENFERLAVLLADLPKRERELVALKYGAEMTNRAIAEATGLSESNVGTILHRVVNALRENWESDDE